MCSLNSSNSPNIDPSGIIANQYLTVQAAAKLTRYNGQYLRRLLRKGKLVGVRVGQAWLIQMASLEAYMTWLVQNQDHRFGPKGKPNPQPFTNVNTPCLHSYTPNQEEVSHERHGA